MPSAVARIQGAGPEPAAADQPLPGTDDGAGDQAGQQSGDGVVDAAGDQTAGDAGDREGEESGGPDQPRPPKVSRSGGGGGHEVTAFLGARAAPARALQLREPGRVDEGCRIAKITSQTLHSM